MFVYREINNANPYAMPEELDYLRDKALELNEGGQVVVIGVGPFVMGLAMLEQHLFPPQITAIDITPFYYAECHLRGAGVDPATVEFVTGDSSTVGKTWTKPIDLLVVDGDHSFEGCRKDIISWWPHVKRGGLAFFHDYLERDGGFNGSGVWTPGGVAQAIEVCRDSSWEVVKAVGISRVYTRV